MFCFIYFILFVFIPTQHIYRIEENYVDRFWTVSLRINDQVNIMRQNHQQSYVVIYNHTTLFSSHNSGFVYNYNRVICCVWHNGKNKGATHRIPSTFTSLQRKPLCVCCVLRQLSIELQSKIIKALYNRMLHTRRIGQKDLVVFII